MFLFVPAQNCLRSLKFYASCDLCESRRRVQVGAAHRAYYTWKGSILEGTPIEPDQVVEFDWRERRNGADVQLKRAIEILEVGRLAQAS
jgi:C-terminal processing protease CtpA/Prc